MKSAHRDLAKVWHPDRFLHDPRLQEKAQEKLKEINEAYELISSGKVPRPAKPAPPPAANTRYKVERRAGNWQWAAVVLFVFTAVFAITIRTQLKPRTQPVLEEALQA